MTLTQLEYIVAIDTYRHFQLAADHCFVTQPTLSMQIQKLEEELGVKIFDRSKQPVIPTPIGERIIAQARQVLNSADSIRNLIHENKEIMSGELRVGIIPTLAPYLLPPLIKSIRKKYPEIVLKIKETITEEIIYELKNNRLDCGLVVTPLNEPSIHEDVLFYEALFAFVSKNNPLQVKKTISPADINPHDLWLLEEGHCLRSQIMNLCEWKKRTDVHVHYSTGHLETLRKMVEKSDGITILPELAVRELSAAQHKMIKPFKDPVPVREVSLITHRDHIKAKLILAIQTEILSIVPESMKKTNRKKVLEIY